MNADTKNPLRAEWETLPNCRHLAPIVADPVVIFVLSSLFYATTIAEATAVVEVIYYISIGIGHGHGHGRRVIGYRDAR